MDIFVIKAQLQLKHYELLKERMSWVNPDQRNLEEMDARISELADCINALEAAPKLLERINE